MEADFTIPDHKERRKAFRVSIADCKILIYGKDKKYPFPAKDMSVLGLCFAGRSKALKPGVVLKLDIVRGEKAIVSGLVAKIVWAECDQVGCEFQKLDPHHEDGLHAIVLAEQKRMASLRKGGKPSASAASTASSGECVESPAQDGEEHKAGPIDFIDPWTSKQKKGLF